MAEKQIREVAAMIEAEWQMDGLTGGLYEDFAVEVAKLAVSAERERCAQMCENVAFEHREGSQGRVAAMRAAAVVRGPNVALTGPP